MARFLPPQASLEHLKNEAKALHNAHRDRKPEVCPVLRPADKEMPKLLGYRAPAVDQGYGTAADLERTEERGRIGAARPEFVSDHAKRRQRREMGTLGSGNHYLEFQRVTRIHAEEIAARYGLALDDIVIS